LKETGVLAIGISDKQIRMVTHCDISQNDVVYVVNNLSKALS
jgi:hypothetical protein